MYKDESFTVPNLIRIELHILLVGAIFVANIPAVNFRHPLLLKVRPKTVPVTQSQVLANRYLILEINFPSDCTSIELQLSIAYPTASSFKLTLVGNILLIDILPCVSKAIESERARANNILSFCSQSHCKWVGAL